MGLFGGSFTTGLASGLATSVGTALKDDMQRRENRLDKLRTFYETRQVQEQDKAKAEDKRTENHLTRLKNETGVGAAELVALFKGLGGTNDSLDNHFSTVDTNKNLGGTFNYTDMLKNSGMDFSQYGNFTMQDAFDNFKYEISAPDINYTEAPSMLSALGLKQDSDKVSASLTGGMQDLVPNVSRKDSGIGSMAMPEGFYGQTIQGQEAQNKLIIKDAADRMGVVQDALMKAKEELTTVTENKNNLTGKEFADAAKQAERAIKKAQDSFNEEEKFYNLMQSAELSTKEMVSLTARRDGYRQEKNALMGTAGIDVRGDGMNTTARVLEEYTYTDSDGEQITLLAGAKIIGGAAIEYQANKLNEFNRKYTIENLVDSTGNFIENTARLMFTDTGGLGLIPYSTYANAISGIGEESSVNTATNLLSDTAAGGGTTAETEEKQAAIVLATAVDVRNNIGSVVADRVKIAIEDGKISPADEANFVNGIVASGIAGLSKEEAENFKESVTEAFTPLFNEARIAERNNTPEGRYESLVGAIGNLEIPDKDSTAIIKSIDDGKKNVSVRFARVGAPARPKELDNVTTDVINDAAEEALNKIIVEVGYDPALMKQNSRESYDKLLGSLANKYKQTITSQREAAKQAEIDRQNKNTLG